MSSVPRSGTTVSRSTLIAGPDIALEEYEALPADGRRYEIHDGELSVTAAPSPQHQMVSANLFRVLDDHVRAGGIGKVLYALLDVILTGSFSPTSSIWTLRGSSGSASAASRGPRRCWWSHAPLRTGRGGGQARAGVR